MEIICITCKCPKSHFEFWTQPKNKSGYESSCKKCRAIRKYECRREKRIEQGLLIKFPTLANRQLAEKGTKYCPGCKQIRNLLEFSTMKVRSGVASHCRECSNRIATERNSTDKGKYARHNSYKRNREKVMDQKLQKKFGITLEQYKQILSSQGNKCAICGKTPEENKKMLAVDHNHATNKNRGLLCSSCNICIGFIEKNKLDISAIRQYLITHET